MANQIKPCAPLCRIATTNGACCKGVCDGLVPEVWDIAIEKNIAPAVHKALIDNRPLGVGQLMRDHADREAVLPARVLIAGGTILSSSRR
jgi:hypothetical protein